MFESLLNFLASVIWSNTGLNKHTWSHLKVLKSNLSMLENI